MIVINNYVASLSYNWDNGTMGFDAKVDYMHDVFGTDFFDGYLGNGIVGDTPVGFTTTTTDNNIRPNGNTSMWAWTLKGHYGDFDWMGQYVGVSEKLDKDLWTQGGTSFATAKGAEPRAWMIEAGYSFPVMGRDSRFSVNYQRTKRCVCWYGEYCDRELQLLHS